MDLIESLEAEHGPLTERVAALVTLVASVDSGARSPREVHVELVGGLDLLRDELLEHFGREEECFFPFLSAAVPEAAASLLALETAHDRICGAITRLVHLSARTDAAFVATFPQVSRVFSRFVQIYAEHAETERGVLREVASRLTAAQREELIEAARGL